ncbi:hypothetical protein A2130_00185 [Candidatus Woesebacteria bacterium GWC2_33_12]|uniref:Peptidase family S51 n=1 Tax=Candidatus Woesebacteria bacterium GW2011_GWB1_33_22 TaxID=1618566 RepID=A0A0G0CMZ7_9BACT|nr:MAG: hypothetical protein UR29_C0010G0028 [Candidatus Woesebacteria bacterium GW2011_GWC2_33_12]KKP42053.1 MAG: hypothetical protein UR33_C0006G0037 [Candidatus Woesebacteria bacterium GW2011_GWA2_33_20]KKP44797.1 MAG: hypothetical protein UR35_C0006G0032 [Candidatus Woesebacteria bacterium GW2011_GWB1_33_22]KKP46616.1 MAG: hypothetical protein UR37_C0006G0066 [Microgenomates group bacterium GW2011_GWC1_33_28]KKP50529.1 MAG: hypothetical protein UR41_C0006G0032 [Candidatus Woesebacteria bact
MKTKYILHGGYASRVNVENDKFFKEILINTPQKLKVLLVFFSKENDRIPVNRDEDIKMFVKNKDNHDLEFEVAEENRFVVQIKRSDIIYFHGGNTQKLVDALNMFSNLKESFEGKVIAAESAGANALSAFYYSPVTNTPNKGLGIVPVKLSPHFDGTTGGKELEEVASDLESCYLPEFKYKVF